jgi:hypothetical protein
MYIGEAQFTQYYTAQFLEHYKYLSEFEAKFKDILGWFIRGPSGAVFGKSRRLKISSHSPFNGSKNELF